MTDFFNFMKSFTADFAANLRGKPAAILPSDLTAVFTGGLSGQLPGVLQDSGNIRAAAAKVGLKLSFSAAAAALFAYLEKLMVPAAILIFIMAADYLTGMVKAWINSEFSSRVGLKGIVRKLCYLMLTAAAMCADYIISLGLGSEGISLPAGLNAAVIVCVWLIINEIISILENLSAIGVPVPGFLRKLTEKLRDNTEKEIEG